MLVTVPADQANKIVASLVEERLAACVNIVHQITSTYRWEGAIVTDKEDLLIIKSNAASWETLRARIKELHSYETPEIISLSIKDGYQPYLDWLNSSVER